MGSKVIAAVSEVPLAFLSSKMKYPKAHQLDPYSGDINQGSPEVLNKSNCPQIQQLDSFFKLEYDCAHRRKTFESKALVCGKREIKRRIIQS